MGLTADLAEALRVGELTPALAAAWQSDQAQTAWNQETDALSMARLCAYSDLVLGVRLASACARTRLLTGQGERATYLAEQWVAGAKVSGEELRRAANATDVVATNDAGAYPAHAAASASVSAPDDAVSFVGYAALNVSPAVIRSFLSAPPPITYCAECYRPATYLRQWLSSQARAENLRIQTHWIWGVESGCRDTRRLAEYVRAGLSPISFVYIDYDRKDVKQKYDVLAGRPDPVLGENTLYLLEQVATGMIPTTRPAKSLRDAWARSQAVLSGSPWRETAPSKERR